MKRAPVGYDPGHPCIDDIKGKDFAASVPLRDEQVTSADFVNVLLDKYRTIAPFMRFLSEALKLRF